MLVLEAAKAADISPVAAQLVIDVLLEKMKAQKAPAPLRPAAPSLLYVENIWQLMIAAFEEEHGLSTKTFGGRKK